MYLVCTVIKNFFKELIIKVAWQLINIVEIFYSNKMKKLIEDIFPIHNMYEIRLGCL